MAHAGSGTVTFGGMRARDEFVGHMSHVRPLA